MNPTKQEKNKALVLEAFDTLFNKRDYEAALAQTKGKVSGRQGAAAKLGMPSSTLESKIRTLRINKHAYKGA